MWFTFVFAGLLTAAVSKPVAAVAPVEAPGFPALVSEAVGARLVELARDSGVFSIFDQRDIETLLRMQKQGAAPIVADPLLYGRLITARKVITAGVLRSGEVCSASLKVSDVETGLVETARSAVTGCSLPDLLHVFGTLWTKAVTGKVRVTVAPPLPGLAASFDGGTPNVLPFETELSVGRHTVALAGDALAAAAVTVDVGYLTRSEVELRVAALPPTLRMFDEKFMAANRAGLDGDHAAAAGLLDEALRAGLSAQAHLPAPVRDEFAAAFLYAEGVRALEQAWLEKARAEATGALDAYCLALEEAAGKFERAARAAPEKPQLGLAAVTLAHKRQPLSLGACAPQARFAERIATLDWPAAATAGALRGKAARNRALLLELKKEPTLPAAQRQWIRAEETLLVSFERWSAMAALKDDLLRTPGETLPRLCGLKREALGYAAAARKAFGGLHASEYPLAARLAALDELEARTRSQGSLCP